MHRALSIGEIVGMIFECASRGTKLALALSNRSFFEQGAPVIWRDASIWNLARTVPSRYWKALPAVTETEHREFITLSEQPRSNGWLGPRFRLYASYMQQAAVEDIKNISVFSFGYLMGILTVESDDGWVHHSILLAWFHGQDDILFPNLQRLEIMHSNPDAILAIGLAMMHSGLRELRMLLDFEGASFEDLITLSKFISNVRLRAPALRKLIFFGGSWPDSFPSIQSLMGLDSLASLTHLESDFVLSESTVNVLSALPNLEELDVMLASPVSDHTQRNFPSLNSLKLNRCELGWQDCMTLLRSITSRRLRSFKVEVLRASTERDLNDLLSLLACHHSLETIYIHAPAPRIYHRKSIFLPTIAPLIELHNITHLSIQEHFATSASDEGLILEFAQAWPLLEDFNYPIDKKEEEMANLTISLTTFVAVLRFCPHLASFSPALDIFSPTPDLHALQLQNLKIRCLTITVRRTQEIDRTDLRLVPEMLLKICPNLYYFEHAYFHNDVPKRQAIEHVKGALNECIHRRNNEG